MSCGDDRSVPDAELLQDEAHDDFAEPGTATAKMKPEQENKLVKLESTVQNPMLETEPTVQTLINLFENPKTFGVGTEKLSQLKQMHSDVLPSLEQEVVNRPNPEIPAEETEGQNIDASFNVSSETPKTQSTLDMCHTVKETENLLNVKNEAELTKVLMKAESKLVFIFFLPGCCDLDSFHSQLLETFLPKIQEAASQEPNILFITVYIDMLNEGWVQWTRIVDYFETCSKRNQTPIGSHLIAFQTSAKIHESMIFDCKELDSAVTDLIVKHKEDHKSEGDVCI